MRILAIAALTIATLITPALAQTTGAAKSQVECEADWKAADANADGSLDSTELETSKAMVPASLVTSATVAQADFITACTTAGTTTQ
jgi:hypothetical protein